ncbi:thermonuclease family protein [Catenovulum sp. 2E275]|uniref:thermonuclease family protein n=1 Tax=Catenovulum sp. 2E275 TaxID=2980497 RepID=UPI0021CE421E|nr:thermonuclease family protein [Catenovulum sp. 2E275]MCU4674599.1 thermonuclease family protein [Catenovulum sp. 2E275]
MRVTHYLIGCGLTIAASFNLNANPAHFGNAVVSEVVRVYDGDTFTVNLSDWPSIIGHEINVRVNGVDTPEIRGKCSQEKALAKLARTFTANTLSGAKKIELTEIQRDKYFRILATVMVDGINLADLLIEHKLAVGYQGGTKHNPWCVN